MPDEVHYRKMLAENPNTSIRFNLAASMVYAAQYGKCDSESRESAKWREIAQRLKAQYGENLSASDVAEEMDRAKSFRSEGVEKPRLTIEFERPSPSGTGGAKPPRRQRSQGQG